jgi:hypothetical protein
MSQLLLSRSPYRQEYLSSNIASYRRTRVTPLKWELVFGPMTLMVVLLLVGVTISILSLARFNQDATKGYDLKRLEVDRQALLNEYEISNMHLAQVKSFSTILSSSRIRRMTKPSAVSFVRGDAILASATSGS